MSRHYVTMTGRGEAAGVPDVLQVGFALEGTGADVAAALDAAGAAVEATLEAVDAHGVADADVRTGQIEVHPRFGERGQRLGFESRQSLAVTIRSIADSGALLRAAAAAAPDALSIDSVSLVISEPEPLLARARDAAFADAERKATQFARLAGRRLGAVRSVLDGAHAQPVEPRMFARAVASTAVPVQVGEQMLSAAVTVTWLLTD